MDLYIYYRVSVENASHMQARVRAMQARLGVPAQLKRRPQLQEGLQTWMEVYLDCADGFDAQLDAAVREAGLSAWIEGARHTEVFMDIATCA